MTRRRAFLTHLAISALLVGALILYFIFELFPLPYFLLDGGWNGVRLIVAVDVVIGPLLTLTVVSPGKTRGKLVFDLTVIGLLQLSALSYGVWTAKTHSTQSVLFADGAFYTVDASTGSSLGANYNSMVQSSGEVPFYGVIDLPNDREKRIALQREAFSTGNPLYSRTDLLIPLSDSAAGAELDYSARKLEKMLPAPADRGKVEKWVAEQGAGVNDYHFFPLHCRYGDLIAAVRKSDRTVAGFVKGISKIQY